jgi:YNFM family putative membrane transporter
MNMFLSEKGRSIIIMVYAVVLTFSALYAPQPLQPVLAGEFGITKAQAALLTTVTMIPLAIAPIFFGYFLESHSSKRLLTYGIGSLSVLQLAMYFADNFYLMLVIRFFVGVSIPAVLTSVMTYLSTANDKDAVQKKIAYYVSATIFGGFAGRFFSGLTASYFGWRWTFLFLALSLALACYLVGKLSETKVNIEKPSLRIITDVLKQRRFSAIYLLIFATFFCFAAVLNFIPFRVTEVSSGSSSFAVGLMYTGYMMGIVISLNSLRIVKLFGGEMRTIFTALIFYGFTVAVFLVTELSLMFFGMFIFCCGMFLAHSVASGYVNKIAEDKKGVTNGLYVAFYYLGGTLGSFLPGFIYASYGWGSFLLSLSFVIFVSIIIAAFMLRKA